MSTTSKPRGRMDLTLVGGGVLMALCCAIGPAVIGAVAGSAVGGWLGIVRAVILAAVVGLVVHRRTRRSGSC
jgi:outer membrane lipoprotein SlyB